VSRDFSTFPLLSLRAFEAVARHGSVKLAAEELRLTPSAVSHALSKLESDLGVVLFTRKARSISLNYSGERLHKHIDAGFDRIRDGLATVSSRGSLLIRIHSSPSFAAQWLTPRLPDFLAEYPGMEVLVSADTNYTTFAADEFDVDIVYGRRSNPQLIETSLGTEIVKPMCSPRLAEAFRHPGDLEGAVLIWSTLKLATWNDWFAANGLHRPKTAALRFDRSFMSIAAAVSGLGVVLESVRLAEREIENGSLVTLFDETSMPITYAPHYLVHPKKKKHNPAVRHFVDWISRCLDLA